jgi:hypothetical protein
MNRRRKNHRNFVINSSLAKFTRREILRARFALGEDFMIPADLTIFSLVLQQPREITANILE